MACAGRSAGVWRQTAGEPAEFAWRRWFGRVTLGEAAGFAIPAAAWGAAWKAGLPPLPLAALVVAGGAGEGALLGWSQATVLDRPLPGITKPWVRRTALAAAAAWAMGMTPSTASDLGAPRWLVIGAGAAAGIPILLSIGTAQWTLLRDRLPRAWRWIAANAGAWLAGLPATFIAPALVPDDSPWWAFAVAFVAAGLVMAATIAAITGAAMGRMLREKPQPAA